MDRSELNDFKWSKFRISEWKRVIRMTFPIALIRRYIFFFSLLCLSSLLVPVFIPTSIFFSLSVLLLIRSGYVWYYSNADDLCKSIPFVISIGAWEYYGINTNHAIKRFRCRCFFMFSLVWIRLDISMCRADIPYANCRCRIIYIGSSVSYRFHCKLFFLDTRKKRAGNKTTVTRK